MENQSNNPKNIIQGVPEPTIRRLPTYLAFLRFVKNNGREYISAPHIANDLRLDPTQVTKDLSYTGISGKTKIGYNIDELIKSLEEFLGYNRSDISFLVGAGNLGSALLKYYGFKSTGLKIVAAFDTDKNKVGKKIGEIEIFHIDKFRNLAERLHVSIGIITTPQEVAQQVADMMIGWGVKAIWNFTPAVIKVPENIIIENTSLYSNLAILVNKLKKTDSE